MRSGVRAGAETKKGASEFAGPFLFLLEFGNRLGLRGRVPVVAAVHLHAFFGEDGRLADVHRFGILGAVAGDVDDIANLQRVFSPAGPEQRVRGSAFRSEARRVGQSGT